MDRIDEDRIADALLAAPGWARAAMAGPDERERVHAAHELALAIARSLDGASGPPACPDQLAFLL